LSRPLELEQIFSLPFIVMFDSSPIYIHCIGTFFITAAFVGLELVEMVLNGSGFFWFWVLRITGKFPEPSATSFFKKIVLQINAKFETNEAFSFAPTFSL
jgi:hypothetical protein